MFGRSKDLENRMLDAEARIGHLEAILDRIDDRIKRILQGADGLASRSAVEETNRELERLRLAVAEGIENAERRENRIRSTVGRALKVLDDHGLDPSPGLEAEARDLFDVDEGGGEDEGVQPVRDDMAGHRAALEALQGVPGDFGQEDLETMIRRRGARTA